MQSQRISIEQVRLLIPDDFFYEAMSKAKEVFGDFVTVDQFLLGALSIVLRKVGDCNENL